MENIKFEYTPINWVYSMEEDEQPIGVLVQVSNGDTQYLTFEEYRSLTK